MIVPRINILNALKESGYNSSRLRTDKIFGQGAIQKLRHGGLPSMEELNRVCNLTGLQPGDILEHIKDGPSEMPE